MHLGDRPGGAGAARVSTTRSGPSGRRHRGQGGEPSRALGTSAPPIRPCLGRGQLRDAPQSGRYPTRGYQQRQPSRERGVADQTDLMNEEPGKSGHRGELMTAMRRDRSAHLTEDSHINDRRSAASRARTARRIAHAPSAARRLQRLVRSRIEFFQPDALPGGQGCPRRRNSAQELGMVLESVVEPIVFGLEADDDARRSPMTGDHDLFRRGETEVSGEIIFRLGQCHAPGRAYLSRRARLAPRLS